jgi:hypothetical protein
MQVYNININRKNDKKPEKITIDTQNYEIINKDNDDILLKKITTINVDDIENLKNYDFKHSNILSCRINNKEETKLKYKPILETIYKIIDDGAKIIKNTKLKIKTVKYEKEGFYYLDNLGISIQGVDSNKCLLEILNQCNANNIKINFKINNIKRKIEYEDDSDVSIEDKPVKIK